MDSTTTTHLLDEAAVIAAASPGCRVLLRRGEAKRNDRGWFYAVTITGPGVAEAQEKILRGEAVPLVYQRFRAIRAAISDEVEWLDRAGHGDGSLSTEVTR